MSSGNDGDIEDTRQRIASKVRSILVVEDDELVQARLEALLTPLGLEVFAVRSAQEARSMMAAMVFPVVLIDRVLGDGDGISLIREMREKYARHRVFLILYSSLDSEEEQARGMAAGADDYISKLAGDEELIKRVRAASRLVQLNFR